MPISVERRGSNDGSVGGDIGVIESDAGEELAEGLIAAPKRILNVEATAGLVDHPAAEQVSVGGR